MSRRIPSVVLLAVCTALAATSVAGTASAEQAGAEKAEAPASAGPTMVFFGDSITAAGGYVRAIDAALTKQNPSNLPKIINRGRSSETVSGLSEAYHPGRRPDLHARLESELEKTKPDWVVACYGMNCGIYHPFSQERFAAYRRGIEQLIEKVHARGARLVLLTPPPYAKQGPAFPEGSDADARAAIVARANAKAQAEAEKNPRRYGYRSAYVYYDRVLARYAQWLLKLAARDGVWVIDLP